MSLLTTTDFLGSLCGAYFDRAASRFAIPPKTILPASWRTNCRWTCLSLSHLLIFGKERERKTEIFFLLTNAMAKLNILFNSGHLYSLIPNNISGHSHATAPFIDNQFDLAHVYVQIEQASAEWKLNADFSTMSTSLKFKVHNGLPSVPISFSYKHIIFLSWLLPTCVTNNSWPGRKCRECKPWICDKTMLMSFVRRSRTQSVISPHSAAHPPR